MAHGRMAHIPVCRTSVANFRFIVPAQVQRADMPLDTDGISMLIIRLATHFKVELTTDSCLFGVVIRFRVVYDHDPTLCILIDQLLQQDTTISAADATVVVS